MADQSRAGIKAEFTFGKGKRPARPASGGTAFRMLVLADFGGHAARGEVRPGGGLAPQRVDLDTLPSVLHRIAPRIPIALGSEPAFTIAIEDMEDFHPDHLFARLPLFAPMRELRRQLGDAKTFARAAALLGKASEPAEATTAPPAAPTDDELVRLLGRPASAAPVASGPVATVESMVRQAVAPYIVGKPDPRQAELIAAVDGMCGELLRAVLHDAGFQRVEAAWRGLERLVRTLELDESLQIFVLDASSEELLADFAAAPDLADSAMYHILVDHTSDTPWSLLVSGNPCGRQQEDAALLARLGTLAQSVEAAVVAGMDSKVWSAGSPSLEDQRACQALRSSPAATAIAIGCPGFLLRLPYGKATDPIEGFAFNEQTSPPLAERYLWGSAAFALAELLARTYAAAGGWDFSPGDVSSVTDLPIHVFTQDGESTETPVAQVWMPESKIDELIKEGLVPLVSVRGRGEARVPRIQSIASPPAALAGRWR
jgi:type VI secretion system protein ImpC